MSEPAREEGRPLLSSGDDFQQNPEEISDTSMGFGEPDARADLERKLVRKIDRRMSILILIYILNYIDRNNAAAARLKGFERDLRLEGNQFATVLSVLYIGYVIMQIPSNLFLNYFGRPSVYLSLVMAVWGVISVLTGLTTSFEQVACARFLLGFVEAAFFPGALFLLSTWYKKNELSQRTALLTSGGLISNAFGSLIASGVLDIMEGRLGFAAWRWLFFIEGSLTVLVAILAMFILPDFPANTRWLSPAERALALKRKQEDEGNSKKDLVDSLTGFRLSVTDGKVWWLAATLTFLVASLSFNAYFPTLMSTIGYSSTTTLLLCVPPWVFATIVAIYLSRHSDRVSERCNHITLSFGVGMLGFVIASFTMNGFARYISLFLMAQSYAGFVCFLAWASSSISHPLAKKAASLALINTVSSFGNILGSYFWPETLGPSYRVSFGICLTASCIGVGMCWIFRSHLQMLNVQSTGSNSRRVSYML